MKMKKILVITLVVIMLSLSVVPAFAAGGQPTNRGSAGGSAANSGSYLGYCNNAQMSYGVNTPYALSGTIAEISDGSITVTVACGNTLVKSYVGKNVTLMTTETTRFLLRNENGYATQISFADLKIGDEVSSHGVLVDGVWTATRITVGALLTCLP